MRINSAYINPSIHLLVWASLLTIPAIILSNISINTGLPEHFFLFTNIYHIGLFYLNAYVLFPKLNTPKTWPLYFLTLPAIVILSWYAKIYFIELADPSFVRNSFNSRIIFFPPVAILFASLIYRIVVNRINAEKKEKEVRAERLGAELKFLRSQVSPHFLFNMMANMVALARKRSELLEPSLIKLSDLLRYMLYESEESKFPLSREIETLESYIELQRLRFGDDVDLQVEITGGEVNSCTIEPMLLVPFVENAFKHGIGITKDPFIRVKLDLNNGQLRFSVSNNYCKERSSKDKNSGIGLQNVINRLKLLYPEKYVLDIKDNGEIYQVDLNIDLPC
jgi:two-component system LytT family sensor kinase